MWLFKKKDFRPDDWLVSAYKQSGDTSIMGELFEKHVKTVYGACLFYFKDKADAQDAVMQIFEKLMIELKRKDVNNFKGWLSFVVRNHCITLIRQNKNKYQFQENYHGFEYELSTEEEENYLNSIKNEKLIENLPIYLNQLNEKQKICIELFFLKDHSYQQISTLTGYTVNEVKSYIQNGKRNLKQAMQDQSHGKSK
ncbi:MAG: RNA polymerase sigma factor [Sphingobacteriaceae bacterium]